MNNPSTYYPISENDNPSYFESDKSGNYRHLYQNSNRGIDIKRGIDIIWNEFRMEDLHLNNEKQPLELEFFKKRSHERIIESYDYFMKGNEVAVLITEMMTSGSLFRHIKQVGDLDLRTIKRITKQILRGLEFLHTQESPIIHRDLKCSNIFIHHTEEGINIKISGLKLSTFSKEDRKSTIGTPEFMAPEMYEEYYSEKVDIWALGMVMLQMITKQYPYEECVNVLQIMRKVILGSLPECFELVKDDTVIEFISLCLRKDPAERPSASDLLVHPFFMPSEDDDLPVRLVSLASPPTVDFTLDLTLVAQEDDVLSISMRYIKESVHNTIHFNYNLVTDVPREVADEINIIIGEEDNTAFHALVDFIEPYSNS